jgi:26S proteasome regulatory subunit N1
MAKETERPTAADKGKGKVDDVRELNGERKSTKDEINGKKDGKKEEPKEGKLSFPQASLSFGTTALIAFSI